MIEGLIRVEYSAYPVEINDTTLDTYEFEIDIEAQEAMPYKVAALCIYLENPGAYGTLMQQFQAIMLNLTNKTTVRPSKIKKCSVGDNLCTEH